MSEMYVCSIDTDLVNWHKHW